jgi:hypothetical protein
VSRLPKYISSVDSKEHSNCKLQYECSRCLETTEKPLDDLHHCTAGDGTNVFLFFKQLGWVHIIHCVTDYYAHLHFCCKPEKSSKFRTILDTQVALTDFYGDEAKKKSKWPTQNNGVFKIANS